MSSGPKAGRNGQRIDLLLCESFTLGPRARHGQDRRLCWRLWPAPLNLRFIMQCRQQERLSVDAGGLMSYSGDARDAYYEVGAYTGRVLKARGRPIYLSNRLPRLSWSSTSRQPERLG